MIVARKKKSTGIKPIPTIHEHHQKMLLHFDKLQQSLPSIKKQHADTPNGSEKTALHRKIADIENRTEELDYYYHTVSILQKYCCDSYDKRQLAIEYFTIVDPTVLKDLAIQAPRSDIYVCVECGSRDIEMSDGCFTCQHCDFCDIDPVLYCSPAPSYKETQEYQFTKPFAYRRTNHFTEWVNQVQGRENTEIPQEIIDRLWQEVAAERLTDYSQITKKKIKEYLKKLKLSKYYEHAPAILCRMTNERIVIPAEIEEKLRDMFLKTEMLYERYKPKDRKNFLSYSYLLRKYCEILGLHDLARVFPLLKSREKCEDHDAVFKMICRDAGWRFQPSV